MPAPAAITLVNGQVQEFISVFDRGLAYGDGLFETLWVKKNKPVFWQEHLDRLLTSAERLGLNTDHLTENLNSDFQLLLNSIDPSSGLSDSAVLKIILTRGIGQRGYRPDNHQQPTRILTLSAYSPTLRQQQDGILARWCSTPVSSNPSLAGMKHLNRLENVLARAEWSDASDSSHNIAEGLMLDMDGWVIEGTMSNVFFVYQGTVYTPELNYSGVKGIIRQLLLDLAKANGIPVELGQFTKAQVMQADEVFVCNSLINIWPIVGINEQQWPVGNTTKRLQGLLEEQVQSEQQKDKFK